MSDQNTRTTTKIARNFVGLRSALFDELDAMRNGTGDIERVRAVIGIAGRLNDTVHAEVKARKTLGTEAGELTGLKGMTG